MLRIVRRAYASNASPQAIAALVREAVLRHRWIVSSLVHHGVCVERACELALRADREEPS